MVQEHWLYPSTLCKLNNISSEYVFFGSSAMVEELYTGSFYGRPYVGTAILINQNKMLSYRRETALQGAL